MQEHIRHKSHIFFQDIGGTGFQEGEFTFHLTAAVGRSVENGIPISLIGDIAVDLLCHVTGRDPGTHFFKGHIQGIQPHLQEFPCFIRAFAQNNGTADTGGIAFHFGSDTEVDDLSALDFPQRRTADSLVGIGTGTAPDGVPGGFCPVGKHGGSGDPAQFRFGHPRFDIFQNGFEAEFRDFGGFPETFQFQRRFLHIHRPEQFIGIGDFVNTAQSLGNVHHNGIGEHVETGDPQSLDSEFRENVLPGGVFASGIVGLGGFPEIHGLDHPGKPCGGRGKSQRLRTDDENGFSGTGDQYSGRFKTGPVIGKVTDSRRFGFGRENQKRIQIGFGKHFLCADRSVSEFFGCQNPFDHDRISFLLL